MKCEVRGERKGLSSLLMSPTIPQLSPVFSGLSGSPLEMRDAHSIHKEGNNSGWRVLPGWVLLLHWKAMCGQPSPRTGQPWKKLELFGISWISPKELVYKHTSPPGTPTHGLLGMACILEGNSTLNILEQVVGFTPTYTYTQTLLCKQT